MYVCICNSAYLHQGTSYQCWDISPAIWRIDSKWLPIHLTVCSLANCQPSLKILCKSVQKLLRKIANKRGQTNRQTDNVDNITFLGGLEVMIKYLFRITANI